MHGPNIIITNVNPVCRKIDFSAFFFFALYFFWKAAQNGKVFKHSVMPQWMVWASAGREMTKWYIMGRNHSIHTNAVIMTSNNSHNHCNILNLGGGKFKEAISGPGLFTLITDKTCIECGHRPL